MTAREAALPPFTRDDLDALGVTCGIPTAARALSISPRHARTLVDRDEFPIPTHRYGGRIVVHTIDLRRHILGEPVPSDLITRLDALIAAHTETLQLLTALTKAAS